MAARQRSSSAEQVLEELGRIAHGEQDEETTQFEEAQECKDKQLAAAALLKASEAMRQRHHNAFGAATYTPLVAPPAWLQPPT